MAELSTLAILMDYAGLIVGFILLLIATAILPGRLKWYVFSAGMAVILFRAWQIWNNRKRLQEADAKREELRGKLDELAGQKQKLETELQAMSRELDTLKSRQNQLAAEASQLAETGDALADRKRRLDEEMRELDEKDRQLLARIEARNAALREYEEAKRVQRELEEKDQLSELSISELARRASALD